MGIGNERVITITLSEADWRAFLDIHPQPVAWLKQKIQEQLQQTERATESERKTRQSSASI
ncbi:MAG TPA: hypothetical protein VGQ81_14105 [Acidobacteriota bacterium]|jgi:hypothetical protein|nr:hypothetical protein [Acidobacteriota bacterium]